MAFKIQAVLLSERKNSTRSVATIAALPISAASQGIFKRLFISPGELTQLALINSFPACCFQDLKSE